MNEQNGNYAACGQRQTTTPSSTTEQRAARRWLQRQWVQRGKRRTASRAKRFQPNATSQPSIHSNPTHTHDTFQTRRDRARSENGRRKQFDFGASKMAATSVAALRERDIYADNENDTFQRTDTFESNRWCRFQHAYFGGPKKAAERRVRVRRRGIINHWQHGREAQTARR